MKKCFTNNDEYTRDGRVLAGACDAITKSVFQRFADQGYSHREIANIMVHSIVNAECHIVMKKRAAFKKRTEVE